MEPITTMLIASAVGGVVSLIGQAIANGEREQAAKIRKNFADSYGTDALPHLDRQLAEEIGPTALASIQEDESLRTTQTGAMRKLADLYESGGMSKEDEAALQLADLGAQQRASSDAASIQQSLAARGQTMNPALAAALAAKSSGDVVNATATNRYRAMADARQRAMQALEASAGLAGGIRGQDYGIKSNAAKAQDAINQFNAGQRTGAQRANTRLQQQEFENEMALKAAQGAALGGVAQGHEQQADRTSQTASGIGQGITSMGAAAAAYEAQRQKKNPWEESDWP